MCVLQYSKPNCKSDNNVISIPLFVPDKKTEKKPDSFAEKLATQVIKNLQVEVSDIHVRYEDVHTNPSKPFSVGVTLKNLSFQVW